MARTPRGFLIDDLDGTDADSTVTLGVDGATYEIDLTAEHAAALRTALEPWVTRARRVSGRRRRAAPAPSASVENSMIRSWAKDNGFAISDRGRISRDVRAAYAAARH